MRQKEIVALYYLTASTWPCASQTVVMAIWISASGYLGALSTTGGQQLGQPRPMATRIFRRGAGRISAAETGAPLGPFLPVCDWSDQLSRTRTAVPLPR